MKKILFILPSLNIGGLERMQVTLANRLAGRGFDVTVMTLEEGEKLRDQLDSSVHFVHKRYKPHPVMKRIPYVRNRFFDDGCWEKRATPRALHRYYIGKEKYDVEIAFFRGLPVKIVSGFEPCNQLKTKHLAWVHSDFTKTDSYLAGFQSHKLVCQAYSRFDRVICVSDQAEIGFRESVGNTGNLHRIYNLLPTGEILKKSEMPPDVPVKKRGFHLVCVARLLDQTKGQVRLIETVAQLCREGYPLSLAIIGSGKDEQLIRDTVTRLDANDYITMTGEQINPYPYIKAADLLVCSSYYEGYNLTVAEALLLGVPVLSTECTGPNEILDHGKYGMIVENSQKGLYDGLKKLLDHPEVVNFYREKAKERQDFFDEQRILQQIIDLL